MANFNPIFFFFLLSLLLPFISSLSTVSISQLSNSNQTLVCALLINQSSSQQSYLNCTSFSPQGKIQIPLTPFAEESYSFTSVVGGDGFVCALSSSSTSSFIVCWRFLDNNGTNTMTYKRIYLGQYIDELVAGNSHICGLINGNTLQCWQWPEFFNPNPNLMITSSLAVGENFLCGLVEIGQIECLPKGTIVSENVPVGNYSLVAAGFRHACAISVNGSLECWGENIMNGGFKTSGKFTSLALGENRSCGMRTNKTVVCWGENNFNLPVSLQQELFISLTAKRDVFCGVLRSNFSLYCWGNDFLDSNSPIFNNVVPGPCRKTCPGDLLPNYADYCSPGLKICEPCITETTTSPNQPLPWLPSPTSGPTSSSNGGKWNKKMVAFLVVGCFGSLLFVVVLSFLFYKHCNIRRYRVHDSGPLEKGIIAPQGTKQSRPVLEKRLSQLLSLGQGGKLVEFSIDFLLQATNNFSEEQKIGTGSFGSVYRAILADGTEVAIKRAEMSTASCNTYPGSTKRNQEEKDSAFVNELELLSCLNHRNLVRLLGYGEDRDERVLVYEYMDNGTLHDHLHKLQDSPLMSWSARIKVALDTARGIEYLHEYAMPPIIHRDIKSSNILLDATWNARVSDFGLSLLRPADDESLITLHAAGTVGYMDPEYYRSQQLTTKSDVYSFGIVLLELISGCKAIHKNENGIPRNVVDYVVPYIVQDEIHRVLDRRVPPPTPFEIEAVAYVGYLAADCVTLEGIDRPTMSDIVNSLERALTACLEPTTLSNSSTASSR